MSVKFVIVIIVFNRQLSTHCSMQWNVSFAATLKFENFTSKLESQPLIAELNCTLVTKHILAYYVHSFRYSLCGEDDGRRYDPCPN